MIASLSGCGIYTKYQPMASVSEDLYGDKNSVLSFSSENDSLETHSADTLSLGSMDWHELFTDRQLQELIERGLEQNTDYQSAALRVDEAAATLKAAKLAFLPTFALAPQAGVSSFNNEKAT